MIQYDAIEVINNAAYMQKIKIFCSDMIHYDLQRAANLYSVGPRFESVWGHHINQRLSENHAGPFVFGATLGKHFPVKPAY